MTFVALSAFFRPHQNSALSRRRFLGSAVAIGAVLPTAANAITTELRVMPSRLPEREGVLPWRQLAAADFGDFTKPAVIPAEVMAYDKQTVRLEGHVLNLDGTAQPREFLLTAVQAHCPFCMPGGMGNMAFVEMDSALKVSGAPVLLEGVLEIKADNIGGPVYKLAQAKLITA
jgi:hypothetical protein